MARPLCLLPLVLCLCASPALSQRYQLTFVPGSVAGEQIELIQHQVETPKKVEQIERFLRYFPNHAATSFFIEWIQSYYLRAGQPDRVIELGEKLLAQHPEDFDAALRCQQAAALKKDASLMNAWDQRILKLAGELVKAAQPPQGLDDRIWQESLRIAKGMLAEREYKEYKAAFDAPAQKLKAQMFEEFLSRYPKSQYEVQTWPLLMNLYRTLGDNARAITAAQKVLTNDADDPDALLLISQILLERRAEHAKIIDNAYRVLRTAAARKRPEHYSPEDWARRKSHYIGTAHLQIGNAYVNQNNFAFADKSLRASLPFVKGVGQTEAAVVFYLGWANYQMENYREAAAFFRQCAGLAGGGEFAERALLNLTALKNERRITE